MKANTAHCRSVGATLGILLALVMGAPTTSADPLNPSVLSPNSPQFGRTYGEWSAAWWQYVLSIPAPTNPLLDATGAKCGLEQAGPVFFLVGTFTVTPFPGGGVIGIANRTECTVPAGVALFFPILNSECSTAEGNGTTDAQLRACAAGLMQGATNLAAEVDGVAIKGLQNAQTTDFRVQSPLFTFSLPGNNLLGVLPQTSPSVADGVYLMLAPLAAGPHTIHFKGEVPGFRLDVSYTPLTVK